MPFDFAWPSWLNPIDGYKALELWLGPERAAVVATVLIGILVLALFVKFVMVPLGFVRRPGGRQ